MFFIFFISFVILQRLAELVYSKRNEKILLSRGGIEYDKKGYKFIVIMHTAFFISFISEYYFLEKTLNPFWIIFVILFALGQVFRYLAIFALHQRWNTKIIILPGSEPVRTGIYKYLRHPNYTGVIIELFSMPLIFSCYITAIIFTLLNLIVLNRRIKIENSLIYR